MEVDMPSAMHIARHWGASVPHPSARGARFGCGGFSSLAEAQ